MWGCALLGSWIPAEIISDKSLSAIGIFLKVSALNRFVILWNERDLDGNCQALNVERSGSLSRRAILVDGEVEELTLRRNSRLEVFRSSCESEAYVLCVCLLHQLIKFCPWNLDASRRLLALLLCGSRSVIQHRSTFRWSRGIISFFNGR